VLGFLYAKPSNITTIAGPRCGRMVEIRARERSRKHEVVKRSRSPRALPWADVLPPFQAEIPQIRQPQDSSPKRGDHSLARGIAPGQLRPAPPQGSWALKAGSFAGIVSRGDPLPFLSVLRTGRNEALSAEGQRQ
jgi:hypothetical protein